jgi:hypothetical protein
VFNAWKCLYDVDLIGTSIQDERIVTSNGNSLFVVLLAEMPSRRVTSLKKVFVIWWNSKEF